MHISSNRMNLTFLLTCLTVIILLMAPLGCFAATGGPDALGYTWADQAEPTVDYDFIDISGTGTQVFSCDDCSSGAINLDEPFYFYGTEYNQLVMCANGCISTDPSDSGADLSNDCPLPDSPSTDGGARLYPLHDDLVATGYVQYFPICPRPSERNPGEGCTVFMWKSARHFGGSDVWDMEAILYHQSGDIVFQIGPGNPELGSGSTTGIQNEDVSDGLTYACNTADSIPDNTAVSFYNPLFEEEPIPTLNEWGMIIMSLLMAGSAFWFIKKERHESC